jgi:predicted alternative tryptophan synthase beta-subunit
MQSGKYEGIAIMDNKVYLTRDEIPKQWYNLAADFKTPLKPPLGPDGNPIGPDQLTCFEAAVTWAKTEGFVCAPETSHAVAAAIEEAVKAREEGKEKVILFNYSGHGMLDLLGHQKYLNGGIDEL